MKQNEEKEKIIKDLDKRVDYLERLIQMNLDRGQLIQMDPS